MFDMNSDGCVGRTEFKELLDQLDKRLDEKDEEELDQFVSIFKDFKWLYYRLPPGQGWGKGIYFYIHNISTINTKYDLHCFF